MIQFQSSFVLAGTHEHRRNIRIAALFGFAVWLAALPSGAQCRNSAPDAGAVSAQLLIARNKQQAGEYNAARDILQKGLFEAPNSVSLLNQLGSVEQDLGEYPKAERFYLQALNTCTQTGSEPERLIILNNLGTLYLDTNDYSKAEQIRELLEKLRPGTLADHPSEAGTLLNVIASLEHARNRDGEAERYYSRSLLLLRQAHGPASVDAALVEANLGFVRLDAQQHESAAGLFRQAIREIEIASGPENPALVRPLVNLARCENMSDHPNEAETVARRAVELSVKIFGEGHPVTATAMLEKATALRSLRHEKLARDLERRAKAGLRNNFLTNRNGHTVSLGELTGAAAGSSHPYR